jgi:hypothetical protein
MTGNKGAATAGRALVTTESRKRPAAVVELIATMGLALSTVVAVTAVSIGIARADVFAVGKMSTSASLATGLLIALVFVVLGGLAAVVADHPEERV